jgi:hypothetical protein
MTPQPSKIVEGQSRELMRAMDLGIQWRSLSAIRSDLGRGSIKYFDEVPLQENRGGIASKLPNVGVAKLIWTIENRGTCVHRSTTIRKFKYLTVSM